MYLSFIHKREMCPPNQINLHRYPQARGRRHQALYTLTRFAVSTREEEERAL
jgi:hypothetical protein